MDEDAENSGEETTYLLSGTVAIIVTHVRGTGPAIHLETYLTQQCPKVLSIYHPLVYESPAMSSYRLFEDGKLVETGKHLLRGPEPAIRLQEVILTIRWVRRLAPRSDLFIGVDALNCIAGIMLRAMKHTKRVIFYVIDWSPKRFDNNILNGIYHLSDRAAALFATEIWNVSPAIDKGRWHGAFWSLIGRFAQKRTRIVEIGVARVNSEIVNEPRLPNRLVFLGHLLEKQGLQQVIAALPQIAESFSDVDLVVIGSGPYQVELTEMAHNVGVENRVRFLGYIEDEDEVLRLLSSASIGVATYLESEESFTKFADPGKLKNYLAAGLPIVMTRVPYNADWLEESGCAVLVKGTVEEVAGGICFLLSEDVNERYYRRASALNMVKGLDWESIFANALTPINSRWKSK
jgi:glycosyltransferase involved in cell wall biosynthesis